MSDLKSSKKNNSTKPALATAFPKNTDSTKNKKKSKHGKKNWRKNIDISDIEKKNIQKDQEQLLEKQVEMMKDDDLFVMDLAPSKDVKKSFLNKKTERKDTKKKISIVEERKIKRISENIQKDKNKPIENKTEETSLWDDDKTATPANKITLQNVSTPSIKFPKVPLPHPGQSYNPSKQDLSSLLYKVIDINKKPALEEKQEMEPVEQQMFISDDESEKDEKEVVEYKANNPAVDDFTQRKTRTEKNKSIQKKLNIIKEMELVKKKENRIKLAQEKSLKRVEKERLAKLKEEEEKKKELLRKKKEKEELLQMGVVDDPDLLNDFQVKKDPVPLRKIKNKGSVLSERFENILKRNVVGEFTHKNDKRRNRKHRKLNKFNDKNLNSMNGGDYGFLVEEGDDKLKIFE